MFLVNAAMEKISIGTAALIVVLGMAVVFFGLILLMYVTKIAGAIINRKKSAEPAAAPAAAPAAPAVKTAPAPGTAGKIALHDVPDKTAAMLMAIVASKTGKPLNQLRFISIREIKLFLILLEYLVEDDLELSVILLRDGVLGREPKALVGVKSELEA